MARHLWHGVPTLPTNSCWLNRGSLISSTAFCSSLKCLLLSVILRLHEIILGKCYVWEKLPSALFAPSTFNLVWVRGGKKEDYFLLSNQQGMGEKGRNHIFQNFVRLCKNLDLLGFALFSKQPAHDRPQA